MSERENVVAILQDLFARYSAKRPPDMPDDCGHVTRELLEMMKYYPQVVHYKISLKEITGHDFNSLGITQEEAANFKLEQVFGQEA